MEIHHREIAPDAAVITVTGKVMMGSESEEITALVSDLLRAGKRVFVLDMAGITRIDSTGIGRFIASYNEVVAAGGQMCMAGAPKFVFQAFHVSRLDTVFRFFPSVDDACKAALTS